MRITVVSLCLLLIVFGFISTACATTIGDPDWYLRIRASSDQLARQNCAGSLQCGMRAWAADGAIKPPEDVVYITPQHPAMAEIDCIDLGPRYMLDQRAPFDSDGASSKTWHLAAYAGSQWQQRGCSTIYITAWNSTGIAGLDDNAGPRVTLYQVNTFDLADPSRVVTPLFTIDNTTNGSYSAMTGISGTYYQCAFPYIAGGMGTPGMPYLFEMVAEAPDPSAKVDPLVDLPEPGTIAALLCGLAGLGGFALRRRSNSQ